MRHMIAKLGLAILVMAVAGMALACEDDKETDQQPPSKAEILINLTAGQDDPHRATLALMMADIAAKDDREVTVFLNIDGVELATKDLPDTVQHQQFPPVRELMAQLISDGATVLACGVCLNAAGIPSGSIGRGRGARDTR